MAAGGWHRTIAANITFTFTFTFTATPRHELQEDYCEGETVRILPCSHAFHAECVDQWLKEKDTCPMCKACVAEEEEEADKPATPAGEF